VELLAVAFFLNHQPRGEDAMKRHHYLLVTILFLVTILGAAQVHGKQDVLFQTSTFDALDKGVAEGDITIGDLKKRGDFGIGTFNAIDGELIVLEGDVYQIRMDGAAYQADDNMRTPFAFVTSFKPDKTASLGAAESYAQLKQQLGNLLPTRNIFHAIKISGKFSYMKARTVPRQERPYPRLAEVFKEQAIFEFQDVQCTLVGFFCPSFMKGKNITGFHFHFLTADKDAGGHVMECILENAQVEIDHIPALYLALPQTDDFFKVEELQ
jgi:acetolactate decarboxylase